MRPNPLLIIAGLAVVAVLPVLAEERPYFRQGPAAMTSAPVTASLSWPSDASAGDTLAVPVSTPYGVTSVEARDLPDGLSLQATSNAWKVVGRLSAVGRGTFLLLASSSGGTATTSVPFSVLPTRPVLSVVEPSATSTTGEPYTALGMATNGVTGLSWALAPNPYPWLAIDGDSGRVGGTPPAGTTSFTYVAQATDASGRVTSAAPVTVTLADPPLKVTGVPSSYRMRVNAVGVTAPPSTTGAQGTVAWSLGAGTLPATLAVEASTGSVKGRPTVTGTYANLRLKAVDGRGQASSALSDSTFSLTVVPALTASVANANVATLLGGTVSTSVPSVNGNLGTLSWSVAPAFPTGAGYALAADGSVSCSPCTAAWNGTLTGRDQDGSTTAAALAVSLAPDGGNDATWNYTWRSGTSNGSVADLQFSTKSGKAAYIDRYHQFIVPTAATNTNGTGQWIDCSNPSIDTFTVTTQLLASDDGNAWRTIDTVTNKVSGTGQQCSNIDRANNTTKVYIYTDTGGRIVTGTAAAYFRIYSTISRTAGFAIQTSTSSELGTARGSTYDGKAFPHKFTP